jgi:hypothetical protein
MLKNESEGFPEFQLCAQEAWKPDYLVSRPIDSIWQGAETALPAITETIAGAGRRLWSINTYVHRPVAR